MARSGTQPTRRIWTGCWTKARRSAGRPSPRRRSRGSDTFTRTVSHAAATLTATAASVKKPQAVIGLFKAVRGYALLLWVLGNFLAGKSSTGRNLTSLILGVGGALLALAVHRARHPDAGAPRRRGPDPGGRQHRRAEPGQARGQAAHPAAGSGGGGRLRRLWSACSCRSWRTDKQSLRDLLLDWGLRLFLVLVVLGVGWLPGPAGQEGRHGARGRAWRGPACRPPLPPGSPSDAASPPSPVWASARRMCRSGGNEPAWRWPRWWPGVLAPYRMEPLPFRKAQGYMVRNRALHRSSPAAAVLGAGATALTIASLLAIAQTTVLPAANVGGVPSTSSGAEPTPALDFPFVAGPLEIPSIGVVAPGFDDWYTTDPGPSSTSAPVTPDHQLPGSVLSSLPADDAAPLPVVVPPVEADAPAAPGLDASAPPTPADPHALDPRARGGERAGRRRRFPRPGPTDPTVTAGSPPSPTTPPATPTPATPAPAAESAPATPTVPATGTTDPTVTRVTRGRRRHRPRRPRPRRPRRHADPGGDPDATPPADPSPEPTTCTRRAPADGTTTTDPAAPTTQAGPTADAGQPAANRPCHGARYRLLPAPPHVRDRRDPRDEARRRHDDTHPDDPDPDGGDHARGDHTASRRRRDHASGDLHSGPRGRADRSRDPGRHGDSRRQALTPDGRGSVALSLRPWPRPRWRA